MKQPIYNTALYLRLSHDDEQQGDSGSIQTQKAMLESYAAQRGFTRACSHKAKHTSFRQILPSAALKIFDARQCACKFLPCSRRKFARKSAHLSYVNRP